jgi:hypothetical protein
MLRRMIIAAAHVKTLFVEILMLSPFAPADQAKYIMQLGRGGAAPLIAHVVRVKKLP